MFLLLCFVQANLLAQDKDFNWYAKKYAGNQIVHTVHQEKIVINMVKNEPVVTSYFTDEHIILTNSGASILAEDDIEFTNFETIANIEAYSMNFKDGSKKKNKVVDFKTQDVVNTGMIFHDGSKITSFIYSGLSEGSLRHLSYTSESKEPKFPFGFSFFSYFPVEQAVFEIDHDTSIHLVKYEHLFDKAGIQFEERIEKNRRIWRWTCSQPVQVKFEKNSPRPTYYAPVVFAQIAYTNSKAGSKRYISNLPDLVDWYGENVVVSMGQEPSLELKKITEEVVQNCATELDKVKAIYYWVQNNIKYIAFEEGTDGFVPRNPNQVCNKRYGDCKDMASLIYKMLQIANIEAHIAWIGSRDLPYRYSVFPSTLVDNHMIAVYYHEGKPLYLDATSSFQNIEFPTYFILGKEALVYKSKDNYRVEEVYVPASDRTHMIDSSWITIEGRKVLGKSTTHISGYYKMLIHDMLLNAKERPTHEKIQSIYEKGNNSFNVHEGNLSHLNDREQDLFVEYYFSVQNYVTSFDDEWYVNMILDKDLVKEKELKLTRKNPFEMDFLSKDQYTVMLEVPSDKKVKSIPENVTYTSDFVDFSVSYVQQKDHVSMTLVIDFKFLLLYPEQFPEWNKFISVLNQATSETVVLTNK